MGVNFDRDGGFSQTGAGGSPKAGRRFRAASGAPLGAVSLADGAGNNQVDTVHERAFSIAAGANLDIDLRSAGGELDAINLPLDLASVKWVFVEITTPGASTSLRVGPQGVTNGWQGPFADVDADSYVEVRYQYEQSHPLAGWSVDATHKVLRLSNPGAVPVTGYIWIAGVAQ